MSPSADQLIFQRLVIFDHAVVDERQFAAGVEMRVRVFVGDFAVGGPACVTDAKRAEDRFLLISFASSAIRPAHFRVSDGPRLQWRCRRSRSLDIQGDAPIE